MPRLAAVYTKPAQRAGRRSMDMAIKLPSGREPNPKKQNAKAEEALAKEIFLRPGSQASKIKK